MDFRRILADFGEFLGGFWVDFLRSLGEFLGGFIDEIFDEILGVF